MEGFAGLQIEAQQVAYRFVAIVTHVGLPKHHFDGDYIAGSVLDINDDFPRKQVTQHEDDEQGNYKKQTQYVFGNTQQRVSFNHRFSA
ncbi:hypothetical protein [Sinorhizobium medicae]|uniref:hypothetical protein n=1 Tax=Sinorhizobium medicae TaxID=110321 RepID=UPI0013E3A585|nr:hypothetical protein [Sinorhizobium medicae]